MVIRHKELLVYDAFMATASSVVGCLVFYYLAKKDGEACIHRRFQKKRIDWAAVVLGGVGYSVWLYIQERKALELSSDGLD